MLHVVAALIERDGALLAGQRRRGDSFALRWEFPGGKVRLGEAPEAALARELLEELGVESVIGPELHRTRHRYAELTSEIQLVFFAARLGAEPRNLAFESLLWIPRADLPGYDFLPADRELVVRLAAGAFRHSFPSS